MTRFIEPDEDWFDDVPEPSFDYDLEWQIDQEDREWFERNRSVNG